MSAGSIAARLQEVASEVGKDRLAERAAIPRRTFGTYLIGAKISPERLVAIADAAGVSLDWLMTGRAPKQRGGMVSGDQMAGMGYVLVPRYEVQAAAGSGAVVHSEQIVDHLAFRAEWVHRMGRMPSNLLVIEATGDSMEPDIRNGDILLVDRAESAIRDNAIYVLVFGGSLVVKRLERRRDGSVIIKSDNPRYAPEPVPSGEVDTLRVVGQVFWHGGLV